MSKDTFQAEVIRDLRALFPDAIVLKNDANYLQGIPDLLILWENQWAVLECKLTKSESEKQPNQDYYVKLMNKMSFAAFIYPGNKEDVLDDLQFTFRARRTSRISRA